MWAPIVGKLIPWVGLCVLGYFFFHSVDVLAGKTTLADIGINFLANISVSNAVASVFGLGGLGYGLGERKLRRRKVETMQARIVELEKKLDPNRSSSGLTTTGDRNPMDP